MKSTTYGKKGGESPTKGKTAALYEGTAPDGSVLRLRSYLFSGPSAWMHISSQFGACWYANAVREKPEDWTEPQGTRQAWVECKRIN